MLELTSEVILSLGDRRLSVVFDATDAGDRSTERRRVAESVPDLATPALDLLRREATGVALVSGVSDKADLSEKKP